MYYQQSPTSTPTEFFYFPRLIKRIKWTKKYALNWAYLMELMYKNEKNITL